MKCEEIVCRAWQGQNTQPQNITWNLLGMMNNCWFRCKVHPTRDDRGALALTFEHPTMPGPQPGGWMVKGEGGVVANKAPPPKVGCGWLADGVIVAAVISLHTGLYLDIVSFTSRQAKKI